MSGSEGIFKVGTDKAVRAMQYELLNNDGSGKDGRAPVALMSFNVGAKGPRVTNVTGVLDSALADAIADSLDHLEVGKVPSADDPVAENTKALAEIANTTSGKAPAPFIVAIVRQESNGQHFHVPRKDDDDTFVLIGLDRNDK